MIFKVGDYVCGKSRSYTITDINMTKAEVIEISERYCEIKIKILKHKTLKRYEDSDCDCEFWVSAYDFEKIKDRTEDFLLEGSE